MKSGVKMTPRDITKKINDEFERENPFGMSKPEAKESVKEFLDQIPPRFMPDGRDIDGKIINSEDYDNPGDADRWLSPGTAKQTEKAMSFKKIYPHERKQRRKPHIEQMPWGDMSP